jgi:formamidopyrimidine-DNA glycosylase
MPELPEVQTVVNDLNLAGLPGRNITGAQVYWPRTIDTLSPEEFCRQIARQQIITIWRRAKYIVIDFASGLHLLIHLRMSGRIHLVMSETERGKHEHVVLDLDNGQQLRFHDTRKFGRLFLVNDLKMVVGKLGPEPLGDDFTITWFIDHLHQKKRQLKPLLLDQTFLAGLGNIYVDEALWEAKLHPLRLSSSLTTSEIQALHKAIRKVLQKGIKNLGTTLGTGKANFYSVGRRTGSNSEELNVFRRTGLQCSHCDAIIERIIVGQRSTHICPVCQKMVNGVAP